MPISVPILAPRERHFMSPSSAHTHSHVCAAMDFHFPPSVFVTRRHHHRPTVGLACLTFQYPAALLLFFPRLVPFIITGTFIKGRHQLRGGKAKDRLGTCTTAHRCAIPCLPFFSSKGGAKFIPTLYLSQHTPCSLYLVVTVSNLGHRHLFRRMRRDATTTRQEYHQTRCRPHSPAPPENWPPPRKSSSLSSRKTNIVVVQFQFHIPHATRKKNVEPTPRTHSPDLFILRHSSKKVSN